MLKLVFTFTLLTISLFANCNTLEKNSYLNDFKFNYFVANEENLSIEDVIKNKFIKESKNNFSLGYIKKDLWIKLCIKNSSYKDSFIITLNEHFYEKFNLYYFDNKWIKKENGIFKLIKDREVQINKLAHDIYIPREKERMLYLQIKGKYGYFGKIEVLQKDSLLLHERFNSNSLFTFSFGLFTIIIIFSLFLFFRLKERIYFFYFGYSFSYLLYIINISGFLSYINMQELIYKLHAVAAFMIGFLILFSVEFLDVKKHFKNLYYIFIILVIIMFFMGTFTLFSYTPWNTYINNSSGLIVLLLILTSSLIYLKGINLAKYYLIALLIYFSSIILFTLMVAGIFDYSSLTRYGFIVGSVIEIIFFSLILVNRYSNAKNKQLLAQEELILLKNKQHEFLTQEVTKHTFELSQTNNRLSDLLKERELLLKEVFHRVKNNFHMVIGMIWLESNKYKDTSIFDDLINRIQSMSKVHEYLINNSNEKKINAKEYLSEILFNIDKTYSGKKNFSLEFLIEDIFLEFDEAMAISIITNELISNSIKHNNEVKRIKLFVNLFKEEDMISLIVKDNGKGFNKKQNKGLGLKLIDQFCEKLAKSKYNFHFEKGTSFKLIFKGTYND